MQVAVEAAPEIDRLVLAVNREAGEKHGPRLLELARQLGLESLEFLPHFGDFLLAGKLTRPLAFLRMRYVPAERIEGRLEELEGKGLIEETGTGLMATSGLEGLLEELAGSRAELASDMWSAHPDDVAVATRLAAGVVAAAVAEHVVAVAHRSLPEPPDPFALLQHRLVTLRYIRQHDHARAWEDEGLSASEVVTLTKLWKGEKVESAAEGTDRLSELGYVEGGPPSLTDAGRRVRQSIEDETNRRAQRSFDVLADADAVEFLESLRRLPDTVR